MQTLLAILFRDTWLHGHVLGQGDTLVGFPRWSAQKPLGWRIGNPLLSDVPLIFYPFAVPARSDPPQRGAAVVDPFARRRSSIFRVVPEHDTVAVVDRVVLAAPARRSDHSIAPRLFVGGVGMFLFQGTLSLSTAAAVYGGIA